MPYYSDAILEAFTESRRSGREVSFAAVGHDGAIKSLKRGLDLRGSTIRALCEELGLEFYVGPPREVPSAILDAVSLDRKATITDTVQTIERRFEQGDAAGKLLQDVVREIHAIIQEERATAVQSDREIRTQFKDLSDDAAIGVEGSPSRPVVTYEFDAAAGGGAMVLDETPGGVSYFRHNWLDEQGLNAKQCCILGVAGDSMETTLPGGCKILVNRAATRRYADRLYVVINDQGLIVKRAGKDEDGGWLLVSDNPAYEPVPWGDAKMIGEVKWMGRTL